MNTCRRVVYGKQAECLLDRRVGCVTDGAAGRGFGKELEDTDLRRRLCVVVLFDSLKGENQYWELWPLCLYYEY